jgi:hypothetical protein
MNPNDSTPMHSYLYIAKKGLQFTEVVGNANPATGEFGKLFCTLDASADIEAAMAAVGRVTEILDAWASQRSLKDRMSS